MSYISTNELLIAVFCALASGMGTPNGVGFEVVCPAICTMTPLSPTGTWIMAPFIRGPTYVGTEIFVSVGGEVFVSSCSIPSRTESRS
jgi:hypothetical protein